MGLFLRGQVWWISFSYRGEHYRRSTETINGKLAQRIYNKILGQIAEERWFEKLPGEKKTFKEMMEKYLSEHASKRISEKSFRGYAKNLLKVFSDFTLSEITPRKINEYKEKRRADGLKPSSVNREIATMKKAFNLAVKEWEWIKDNPAAKVSLEREDNKRDRWLTTEEERNLLAVCPHWLRELTVVALNSGLRLSEILTLTWKGVDLFRRTVTVLRSKNGEKRTIPINETLFDILKAKSKIRSIQTDLVFPNRQCRLLDKCKVSKAFRIATKEVGIQDFKFHDLRHSFATRLVQGGIDLYRVQTLLGHKSPLMSQRYAHHCPESLREGVGLLDKFSQFCHSEKTENLQVTEKIGRAGVAQR